MGVAQHVQYGGTRDHPDGELAQVCPDQLKLGVLSHAEDQPGRQDDFNAACLGAQVLTLF